MTYLIPIKEAINEIKKMKPSEDFLSEFEYNFPDKIDDDNDQYFSDETWELIKERAEEKLDDIEDEEEFEDIMYDFVDWDILDEIFEAIKKNVKKGESKKIDKKEMKRVMMKIKKEIISEIKKMKPGIYHDYDFLDKYDFYFPEDLEEDDPQYFGHEIRNMVVTLADKKLKEMPKEYEEEFRLNYAHTLETSKLQDDFFEAIKKNVKKGEYKKKKEKKEKPKKIPTREPVRKSRATLECLDAEENINAAKGIRNATNLKKFVSEHKLGGRKGILLISKITPKTFEEDKEKLMNYFKNLC